MQASAVIPIFFVSDVDAAVKYYVEKLVFVASFRYGTYAGMRLGSHEIHLTDPSEPRQIVGAGTAYAICTEVDGYFAKVRDLGARLKNQPEDRQYGMRDFAVFDLDGNQITFGCDIDR